MALNSTFNPIAPWAPVLPIADGEVVTWNDTLQAWTNSQSTPGSGDVTASGTLALNAIALGAGTTVVKTTTTGTGVVTLIAGNATGTGALVGSNSPTFVDDFDLGAAGVRFTGAAGVLTLLGLGAGADESLTIDLDGAGANTIAFGTGSGVTTTVWPFIQQLGGTAGVALSASAGKLTLLGLGSGADESLIIDLDTTTNTIGLSSGSGANVLTWAGSLEVLTAATVTSASGGTTLLTLAAADDTPYMWEFTNATNSRLTQMYLGSDGFVTWSSDGGFRFISDDTEISIETSEPVFTSTDGLIFYNEIGTPGAGTTHLVRLGGNATGAGDDVFLSMVDAQPGDDDTADDRKFVVYARNATAADVVSHVSTTLAGWWWDGAASVTRSTSLETKVQAATGQAQFWIEDITGSTAFPYVKMYLSDTNIGNIIPNSNATDKLRLGAWDVDGAAAKYFLTLTSGNTPDMTIAPPSGGTVTVQASTFKSSDGTSGASSTGAYTVITSITVKQGLITAISGS